MSWRMFVRDDNWEEDESARREAAADPDMALITDYVSGEMTPEQAAQVRARLEADAAFRDLAAPILLISSIPPRWQRKPLATEEQTRRSWLQFRILAGMPHVHGQADPEIMASAAAVAAR